MRWITGLSLFVLLAVVTACQPMPAEGEVPDRSWAAGDMPGHFPGRSGELRTVTVGGQDFTYEVIDGLAIYQSDMVLGDADEVELALAAASSLQPQGTVCDHEHIASMFGWFCGRWADADVPYSINENWGDEATNLMMRRRILDAIEHWEAHTNLRFHEASGGVRIDFRNGEGCSSRVGRQENIFGGSQSIHLHPDCQLGAAIHEIGHAVGLFHEQSRNDRDSYVSINYQNIEDGKSHNFNRTGDIGNDQGSYDFSSVMHYSCRAFSLEPLHPPTINILAAGVTCADVSGQVLSEGDILAAYFMYPPSFSLAGLAASYGRDQSIAASITTDRAVAGRFLYWFVDGTQVATGTLATIRLDGFTVGPHDLEARMVIDGVQVGSSGAQSFTLSNVAPQVSITAPTDGQEFCVDQSIEFRAQVFDADSPGRTLRDDQLVWTSGGGAELGAGAVLREAIATPGAVTVTVTATDSDGGSDRASVDLLVNACTGSPPSVSITNPANDLDLIADIDENGPHFDIVLAGEATDPDDGMLTGSSLEWFRDNAAVQPGDPTSGQQSLGTGSNVAVRLSGGSCGASHLISLVATDADGLTATATRHIRIQSLC